MYRSNNELIQKVMVYLYENHYTAATISTHRKFYYLLENYFCGDLSSYSYDQALEWTNEICKGLCKTTVKIYRSALSRFQEAYENKEITNTKKAYQSNQHYQNLSEYNKELLIAFLEEVQVNYKVVASVQRIRISVARFLAFVEKQKIAEMEHFSHRNLVDFYIADKHKSSKIKDVYNDYIRMFLQHLVSLGILNASLPILLDKFIISRIIFISDLPQSDSIRLLQTAESILFSADEFYRKALYINILIKKAGYSQTMIDTYRKIWEELYVFLAANKFGYSPQIALTWVTYIQKGTERWKVVRHAIMLFEQFLHTGNLQPEITYRYKSDATDSLPDWCREDYNLFISRKKQSGFAPSTLNMYRASCMRLFTFLIQNGITSWSSVTPEVIKRFQIEDWHTTPEGKNAYSSKIRGFLDFLSDKGNIPETLSLAVSSECASRVQIVNTLNEKDLLLITQQKQMRKHNSN